MQIPLQVAFHGLDHSDALQERIQGKVEKLEQFFDRITSCKVVIEPAHKNASKLHHKGETIHIRIDLTVPGAELVVKRDSEEHEDPYAALKDAFLILERQLKEYAARMKAHS